MAALFPLATAIFFAAACSDGSDLETLPLPRVLEVKAPEGLRCGLASIYYRFDLGARKEQLHSSFLASPDGLSFAAMDPQGVRVFDVDSGLERIIEGTRPVMWSRDSKRLYVIDNGLRFLSYSDGRVADEPWLNAVFRDALKHDKHIGRPDLHFAGDGLIAVPHSAGRIMVANVERQSTFWIWVGVRDFAMRPYSDVKIGWNTRRNLPAVFVAYQTYSDRHDGNWNPHAIRIVNRFHVYGPEGSHEFSAELEGSEVDVLPLLLDGRLLVLSRLGEHRCINALTSDGKVTSHLACDTDLNVAYLDRRGHLLAARTFLDAEPHNELHFSGAQREVEGARFLAGLADGRAIYIVQNRESARHELAVVADGKVRKTYPVPSHQCVDRDDFPQGVVLKALAADGFPAHGLLFSPPKSTPIKALVLSLHGGPRSASKSQLMNPFPRALLERGYAVAAVNYRGSTGYGRAVLEKPYGRGFSGMLEDADAIRRAAFRELNLPATTPVVLHGVSYGGFLAIKAAIERTKDYQAFIIHSGVCRVASSVGNLSDVDPIPLPLSVVPEPDSGVHTLRLATDIDGKSLDADLCNKQVGAGARIVVIHATRDPNASFKLIESFVNLQDKDKVMTVFADGVSHDPILDAAHQDQKVFSEVVAGIVRFIEERTAKHE